MEWEYPDEVFTEADFQKIMASGIDVSALGTHREDYHEMVAYLERLNDFIDSNSRYVEKIQTPQSLEIIKGSGKFGLMLTFQDSEHFRTADDVDRFWELGQSVSQITYNWQNRLGCGSFVDFDTGLTKLGRDVIRRMNRVGMAVDVSHCGDRTTLDAIEASDAPVLMTHAICRALNPGYPRAKTDEMIKKMAATGGVMGLAILRFMVRGREPVTVEHFLDHIDHMADLVGPEHIGIGSDLYGRCHAA